MLILLLLVSLLGRLLHSMACRNTLHLLCLNSLSKIMLFSNMVYHKTLLLLYLHNLHTLLFPKCNRQPLCLKCPLCLQCPLCLYLPRHLLILPSNRLVIVCIIIIHTQFLIHLSKLLQVILISVYFISTTTCLLIMVLLQSPFGSVAWNAKYKCVTTMTIKLFFRLSQN